jgi:hypothetical protein
MDVVRRIHAATASQQRLEPSMPILTIRRK